MGLKEFYLKAEDKWYDVLDRIDAHIPVYKIVDKIDTAVPSFALFVGVVVLLAVAFVVLNLNFAGGVSLTVTIEDAGGNLLEGVSFDYTVGNSINSAVTNKDGKAVIFVPANSTVEIMVPVANVDGVVFEEAKKTIFVEDFEISESIVLMEESPAFVERTILFQNGAGERITGRAIRVRLSCENPLVSPSPLEVSDLDFDGSITVKEPRDCGIFQATVLEPEEFSQKRYILNQGTQTLRLEALPVAKGTARIKIKDSGGNLVLSNNFNVKLLDSDGLKAAEKYSQNYGEVIFSNITAGIYSVVVEDVSGDYGIANQSGISVSVDEITSVNVTVGKSIKVTLNVSVVEKETGNEITGVTLKVIDLDGKTIAEKSTGEENTTVFRLTEDTGHQLFAVHNDYLYEIVNLPSAGTLDIEVEMEKITASNSGRVEVKVVDEDNFPVKNARVKLRFLDTGMLVPIEPEMTDSNGFAGFAGVKSGSYYAYVEKYPASGDNQSQGMEIDIRTVTKFTVVMIIGDSVVQVNAFDEDLLPVAEAEAEFFALSGESLGKIPLTDGTGQFDLKADKMVFVVVTHSDFMAIQAMPKQLWPNEIIHFDALMEPKLILGEPELEFAGIFDETGIQVQEMNAGKRYIAKFKLSIPESGDYGNGGIHFRVGDERFLINDPLVIKEAVAGGIEEQLKGTSYSPPAGYDEDLQNVTVGDAKWANIFWNQLEPMNYYVGFEVRVKSQITPYTRLPMHYRAWAVNGSRQYIRTPEDSELGFSESVSGKQSLYAKTRDIAFLEGQAAECQEDFCYSGESILDEDLGLYIYKPYEMRAGSPHNYTFSILNNSERQYSNSELYITVDGITIDSYAIQNASAQEISNVGISTKEIEAINLGTFTKGKSVSGNVHFTPNTIGLGEIEVKVIADGRVVFQKSIFASILSENEMVIAASPAHIPSYVATALEISIYDPVYEYDIDEAFVRVNVKNPDKTELFYTATTNGFGKAIIDLPALDPRTVIIIEAEKPDYFANPLELVVDSNILRFEPPKVETLMETRGAREQLFNERIENTTGLEVEIKNVSLTGRFNGLLDRQTMENYSKQFIGTKIKANDYETFQFFKTRLSENIESIALGNETLYGEYIVTSYNEETGIEWDTIIPLEVAIKISNLPDNAPCIVITRQEWLGSTQENRSTIEFQVQNNCITGGRASELDSLQAKLSWNSDIMGQVELSLTDPESGQTNTETLKPEMRTKIISGIRPESTFYGMLTFTPMSGFLGKDAVFSVGIDGAIKTSAGKSFVGSTPNEISSSIRIINLNQCIQYPGAEDIIEMSGDTANFTVDTSQCGEISIDIELCQNDTECRSGTSEGGITVTPTQFTLNATNPAKEVLVARQSMAGMYGIHVSAKTPGKSYRKVALIDVLVKPEGDETFTLDKYAFTLVGTGSQDNATLTNKDLAETISVDASACDWGTAEEKGMFDLAGAGMGAAVGAIVGMQNAAKATSAASQAISLARTGNLTGAESAVSHANQLTNAASTAGDAAQLASQTARQEAITTAAAATKAALTATNAILPPCGTAVKATVIAANSKMASVETTANGTFWAKVGRALSTVGRGVSNIGSAVASVGKAKNTATPSSTGMVSEGPYNSQADLDNAISSTESASADLTETGTEWGTSLTESQAMAAELKVIVGELGTAQAEMAEAHTCCGFCSPGPCCIAQSTAADIAIEDAIITVDNAVVAVEAASAEITGAQTAANNAASGLTTANQSLVQAKSSMGSLGNTMATAGKAAGSGGTNWGTLGTYAALGAVAGGLLGGVMGEDPCAQRVTGSLMDYMINLKDDAQPISVDNELISGWWNTDDAKVFGNYSSQEVGLYFENMGLEESNAIYGVVSLPAERHYHANPTMASGSGFGPFNVPDQSQESYAQKFHLKFVTSPSTSKIELLPQETYSCLQGSLFGQTGAGALPDVKLNWSWGETTGIAMDDCDYYNENGIYCDATQFSIALTKKMQSLREFLEANQQISCPVNPSLTDIEEITEEFHAELEELGMDPLQLYYPGCWMPLSTTLWDGQPVLLYFVEEAAENNNVNWTSNVQDLGDLKNLISFKARLIKDGYSEDFQNDFAEFYTTQSFYDSPNYFGEDGAGKWSDYFEDTENLRFKQKFVENTSLPDAGVYNVLVNAGFNSENWEFFDADGNPDAVVVVEFLFLGEPYPNSVFYYLPFNGNVGVDSGNGRNGYGVDYVNSAEPIAIASSPEMVSTREIYGSNPVAEANIEVVSDFKTINSIASKRGFLLELEGSDLATVKNISFYPNYATPVIMKIPHEKTNESFSAFYEIKESQTPVEAGTSLSFWTGAGQCLDFSGQPVYEAFRFKPDRSATQNDPLSDWLFAYATDWDSAIFEGDVYLKAVFYSPITGNFNLKSLQPSGLQFISPDSLESNSVDLHGIAGMQHNSGSAQDIVSEVQEIFDLVEGQNVCVTDTGSKTSFWWNPKALNDAVGSKTSISNFESNLVEGSTCIGYGS